MRVSNKDFEKSCDESWKMSEEDDNKNYSYLKKETINYKYSFTGDFKEGNQQQTNKSNIGNELNHVEQTNKKGNIYTKKQAKNIFALYKQCSQIIKAKHSDYTIESKVSDFIINNKVTNNNNIITDDNNNYYYSSSKCNNNVSFPKELNQNSTQQSLSKQDNSKVNDTNLILLQNNSTIKTNSHKPLTEKLNISPNNIISNKKINEVKPIISSFLHYKKINSRNLSNNSLTYNDNITSTIFPSNNDSKSQINKIQNKNKFVPSLNEHSLRIAANLPSFEERVIYDIKQRKIKKRKHLSISPNVSRNKSFINLNKLSHDITYNNKSCSNLYERGCQMIKKRREQQQQHKIKKENSYLKYPFKPNLNNDQAQLQSHSRNKCNSSLMYSMSTKNIKVTSSYNQSTIYLRSKRWIQRIQNKISKTKIKETNKIMTNCTFKPKINKKRDADILTVRDIKKCHNLNQNINCNPYVKRRQKSISNKEKEIEKYNKIFPNGTGFHMRTTFPKEFSLCSYSKTKRENKNVSQKRKELGISSFFEDVLTDDYNENNIPIKITKSNSDIFNINKYLIKNVKI